MKQYTVEAICTVKKQLLIEATSLEEAQRKAEEWDVIDDNDQELIDYQMGEVKEEK